MAKKKGGFGTLLYETIMPKIYGIGAADVIVGALFKIEHWNGANDMLIIGLGTEAVIFFLSAFEPKHAEVDWSKVYPELSEEYEGPSNTTATRISTSLWLDIRCGNGPRRRWCETGSSGTSTPRPTIQTLLGCRNEQPGRTNNFHKIRSVQQFRRSHFNLVRHLLRNRRRFQRPTLIRDAHHG